MAWNGSDNTGSVPVMKPAGLKPAASGTVPKVLLAAAVVVVLAVVVAYFFLRDSGRPVPKAPAKPSGGTIVEVQPACTAKSAKEDVEKGPIDPKDDYDHTRFYRDDRGILRYLSGCRAPDPTRKPGKKLNLNTRIKPSVFSNSAERAIFQLARRKPGGMSFAKNDWYDRGFEEEFRKALKDPIRLSDSDTPRERFAKEMMIEVREEIVARMRAGESLGDILSAAEKETKRLREYKRSLEKQVGDIVEESNGKLNPQDVKDLVRAANEMLAKEGLSPIKDNAFVRWNLQLSGQEEELQDEAIPDAEVPAVPAVEK